jgi:glycosyltransferase involved in cell wall biosynthesis
MGEKYLTTKSNINISVSASNQQSGKKYIRSFQSVVINNGIDQKKFNPAATYKNVRAELNIPADKILVLFIARFTSHKQPLALIHAFEQALGKNPALHLLMVGDGDQKQEAVELIQKKSLDTHITLQPFRQDVPSVLASADIFVLPSLWEGLPIGLLEAMAMGKAIIASNVDGTSEIIQNEQNGILVETENLVNNLSKALVNLSGDESKRRRFGNRAIETVQKKYSATEMTRQIEQIYISLVNK